MLSPELVFSLEKLRHAPIKYSPTDKVFSLHINGQNVKKRGLTRVLREVFPVPFSCSGSRKRRRKSDNDPIPIRKIWHRSECKTESANCCKDATLACKIEGLADDFGSAGFGPHFNRRHGITVDEQLKSMVKNGLANVARSSPLDPCVATLRDFLRVSGLCIVASQVPIYSADLDIATAFDIVCTDRATRSEMHLREVKATTSSAADDEHYTRVRGRLESSVARGTPLSYYVQHQLQLGVQENMIKEVLGRPPTSSSVLRISPNCVAEYPRSPWFEGRSAKLLPALRKRVRRKRANKLNQR
jgi:hypothetical protein